MTDATDTETDTGAKEDWERRIYLRTTDTSDADPSTALPAPTSLSARPGAGLVHLAWPAVEGAAGYVIERTLPGEDAAIVRHGGSDVPAVVATSFADTNVADGVEATYRVGAVAGAELPAWHWSPTATAGPDGRSGADVAVAVHADRAVGTLERPWRMLGSERLTQLRFGDDGHGHDIGTEFAEALRIAHDDLGLRRLRAHAILHDDNAVVTRGDDGKLAFDFGRVDDLYDLLIEIGIRPVVEVSFMPAAIARDPEETVFTYRGIISPPQDWDEWGQVVGALAAHLVERYGIDEVASWGFEVWNEPNLQVFWTGTRDEYLRLYEVAARAIKAVDGRLLVGGPSTAAGEWIDALAAHCADGGLPLDFVTTHTYGNLPLDYRSDLASRGFGGRPIWWTEWGVGSTHFGPIHDAVIGVPFVLSGFASAQGRLEALAYWVVSDHFEELGRPPRLFHNGFGLLSVGNLRKPRYWGVHLAEHQGDTVVESHVEGDGADVLVSAWATRHEDGTLDVLVWNGTINGELVYGDERLRRRVTVRVEGLGDGSWDATVARVDEHHSNIVGQLDASVEWPDEADLARLRAGDHLHTEDAGRVAGGDGPSFELDLPMPGVVRVRLTPATGVGA